MKELLKELEISINNITKNSENKLDIEDCKIILEQIKKVIKQEKKCEHPFKYVVSRCNGEINHCLK